ncbi:MAG: hypothetical protein DDT18_01806 [Actinobacteria bacterium]|nr:hypothetical protein [Actinomycetota bacterium]
MYQKIINFTPLEKLKSFLKKSKFLDSLTGFIKYHNAFAIGVSLIFVFTVGAFAASPDFRENFISSQETVRSVDNSYVLTADLDNFSFGLKITGITEDPKNYYITYTYKTIAIQDYVWQEVEKENTLTVSKPVLGDRDLGLYVAEELGEVIDYELSYLKEVQQIEKEKGLTQKIVATQYAGLIGRFLNPKEKVFEGYQPVVQPEEVVSQPQEGVALQAGTGSEENLAPQPVTQQMPVDRELIRQLVQEILAQQRTQPAEQPPAEQPVVAGETSSQPVTEQPPAELFDSAQAEQPPVEQ